MWLTWAHERMAALFKVFFSYDFLHIEGFPLNVAHALATTRNVHERKYFAQSKIISLLYIALSFWNRN